MTLGGLWQILCCGFNRPSKPLTHKHSLWYNSCAFHWSGHMSGVPTVDKQACSPCSILWDSLRSFSQDDSGETEGWIYLELPQFRWELSSGSETLKLSATLSQMNKLLKWLGRPGPREPTVVTVIENCCPPISSVSMWESVRVICVNVCMWETVCRWDTVCMWETVCMHKCVRDHACILCVTWEGISKCE